MDITLTRAIHFLTGMFMPLWIIGVAGILIFGLLAQRDVLKDARQKIFVRALFAVVLPFILACIGSSLLQKYFANRRLKSFATGYAGSLILHAGATRVEIKDPAAISNLLSSICRGHKVWAHHTHPVDKIELFLPSAGYTYSLGKDSEVKDEFWLDWVSYPESDPSISSITTVRQFRSSELSARLEQYTGRGEQNGPANGSQPVRSLTNQTPRAAGSRP